MSRWKAGAIHFSISLAVFLLLLAIILLLWYPGILFSIDGGWTGLQIIIGVDLVLGPLLTLIVFKSGKPGLKFDLSCIATAQAICIAAGMWIVYEERPLALVLAYDTIYSITEQEFIDHEKSSEILEDFAGSYPKLIYIELPEGEIQRGIAALRSQYIGDPLYIQTENYQGIPESSEAIVAVFLENEMVRAQVSEDLQARLPEACMLSKFVSSVTSGYVCFDPDERIITNFYANEYTRANIGV